MKPNSYLHRTTNPHSDQTSRISARSHPSPLCVGFLFALASLCLAVEAGPAWADSSAAVPEGLSTSDWSSIRAAYEANRHAAFAVEDGYQARNPGQQWRTRFDGRGFVTSPDSGSWSWGLELVSYGRAGTERAVDRPTCVEAGPPLPPGEGRGEGRSSTLPGWQSTCSGAA